MRDRSQRPEARGRRSEEVAFPPTSPQLRAARRLLPLACCLLSLSLSARAGELLAGRLHTAPERVFVNQVFELHFELEVTPGSEVEYLRISDFPNDANLVAFGRLETTSRTRGTRDGQPVEVLHFTASGRGHLPIERTFNPNLQCTLVQRRSTGFFSQWQSTPRQLRLAPFSLCIQPLPTAGRPAHFSGAVGAFKLAGQLSRSQAQPGDIITLTLELAGQGWLGDARAPSPEGSTLFKTYPPKELAREPLRVRTEQVFIPQSTNASEIAAVRFSYFNPASAAYEESVAGPFRLTFSAADSAPKVAGVRVINTSGPRSSVAPGQAVTIEDVNQRIRHLIPLLIICASALAAFFAVFQLYGRHPRLAALAGVLLLAAGGGAGHLLNSKSSDGKRTVSLRTEALFAPSLSSAPLFVLAPGTPVTPLEAVGPWVRVDAAGRRGWIIASSLGEAGPSTPPK